GGRGGGGGEGEWEGGGGEVARAGRQERGGLAVAVAVAAMTADAASRVDGAPVLARRGIGGDGDVGRRRHLRREDVAPDAPARAQPLGGAHPRPEIRLRGDEPHRARPELPGAARPEVGRG